MPELPASRVLLARVRCSGGGKAVGPRRRHLQVRAGHGAVRQRSYTAAGALVSAVCEAVAAPETDPLMTPPHQSPLRPRRAYASLAAAPLGDEGRTSLRFLIQAMALRALAAQNAAGVLGEVLPGLHLGRLCTAIHTAE